MNYIMPRVIKGNRGDLTLRWSVINVLEEMDLKNLIIFYHGVEGLPETKYKKIRYGFFRNVLPRIKGIKAILNADINLWAGGLDFQDDSSRVKLLYLLIIFSTYKLFKIKNYILFQGAGPITTRAGRFLTKIILNKVDLFIARDPESYQLITEIAPDLEAHLGYDAIFFPGFEKYSEPKDYQSVDDKYQRIDNLTIGINIRQWFHHANKILPYQFNQRRYIEKSKPMMEKLLIKYCEVIQWLIDEYSANIVLISAYQPGIEPWEDEFHYLMKISEVFENNDKVRLMEKTMDLEKYFRTIGSLDLMIGMRLHPSLIALRLGVPTINLSYTLKGRDILEHMGLGNYVLDLKEFIESTKNIKILVGRIIDQLEVERILIDASVERAIKHNVDLIKKFF